EIMPPPRRRALALELRGEAFGGGQAVAVFDEALDEAPVGVVAEANADPALRTDVSRREEAVGIAADEYGLCTRRRFAPHGPPFVFRQHDEDLVSHAPSGRRVAAEELFGGLREGEADLSEADEYLRLSHPSMRRTMFIPFRLRCIARHTRWL